MAPERFVADSRRSALRSDRNPFTTPATIMAEIASTTMISTRVNPCTVDRGRRIMDLSLFNLRCSSHAVARGGALLPGLDVVGGAVRLVGAGRADVRALRILLARATQDEVLAPRILRSLLRDVLLRHEVFHAAWAGVVVDHELGDARHDLGDALLGDLHLRLLEVLEHDDADARAERGDERDDDHDFEHREARRTMAATAIAPACLLPQFLHIPDHGVLLLNEVLHVEDGLQHREHD